MSRSKKTKSKIYSDAELADIALHRRAGLLFHEIAEKINKKYKKEYTPDSIQKAHRRYGNVFETNEEIQAIDTLKTIARTKRANSRTAKENREILDFLNFQDDLLEKIQTMVKKIKLGEPRIQKRRVSTKKKMTKELMVCDIHVGKLTEDYDFSILRSRLQDAVTATIEDIKRDEKFYNVERLIVALLGDMIESFSMHGLESAVGCEFGNSEQVQNAIICLFEDVLSPLAQLGIKMDVPAVTGNHDRTERNRTYHNPGSSNLTWIIYNTLEMLCQQAGFKHVKFHIPVAPYVILNIYGNAAHYEHLDNAKSPTKAAFEKLINDRQVQEKVIIDFLRGGHWHEYQCLGRGRIIVGESAAGQDSYAKVKGFDTHAGMVLNSYVETKKRPTCFFKSFPIYLG